MARGSLCMIFGYFIVIVHEFSLVISSPSKQLCVIANWPLWFEVRLFCIGIVKFHLLNIMI